MFKAVLRYMNQKYEATQAEFTGNTSLDAYMKALDFMEKAKGPSPNDLRRMTGLKLDEVEDKEGDEVKGIN